MIKVDDKINYRRGLKSDNASQKNAENELSSVYSKVSCSSKVVNQKYFYSNLNSNDEKREVVLIKTKEKIKIKKKEKENLIEYLNNKEINIKYFENFEGYINLVKVQWFDKRKNIYIKRIYIYFYNLLLKIKDGRILIINMENEKDINIVFLLLNNYLYSLEKNVLKKDFFNFSFFKRLNSNIHININLGLNCQELLEFFFEYKEILLNLNANLLLKETDFKKYVYLQITQDKEISKYEEIFKNNKEIYELYKKNITFFNEFKGAAVLIEFNIISPDKKSKFKKYVIVFLDDVKWKWRLFFLSDNSQLYFVLLMLKMPWFEDNYVFDFGESNRLPNFVRTNTSLYNNDDEYFLNIKNCKPVFVKNKEDLIYNIEYLKLFL